MLARTGARPRIFLANLGRPADFNARAAFARSLFEAGGIEAVSNDSFADHAAMAAAFRRSGCKLACLCSSDDIYAREAADAARALRSAGATLWLAGRPGALETALADAGVGGFIFAGCDALAALRSAYAAIAS
jgi:methylmalonyl-CoA mutase